jgi:hypothetical protein
MRDLRALDPSMFDERTYTALIWVRATLISPEGAPPEIEERFSNTFTPKERKHIIAAMKGMYFFNLTGNTLDTWLRKLLRRPDYQPGTTCQL